VYDDEFLIPKKSDPNAFISVWSTSKTSSGSSNNYEVKLPLISSGTYNFLVKWGDGYQDTITSWNQAEVTHHYAAQGTYIVSITGMIIGWRFNNGGDKLKIIEIKQWGCLRLGNNGSYFYGCSNLNLTATDNLNLQGTTNLGGTFAFCENLGCTGNMNGWDVSKVINMSCMFDSASSFNQDISSWNVSSVIDMSNMFRGASSFNQPAHRELGCFQRYRYEPHVWGCIIIQPAHRELGCFERDRHELYV